LSITIVVFSIASVKIFGGREAQRFLFSQQTCPPHKKRIWPITVCFGRIETLLLADLDAFAARSRFGGATLGKTGKLNLTRAGRFVFFACAAFVKDTITIRIAHLATQEQR
jgi:hypothetical protein